MALTEIDILFDLHQIFGADFDARRTKIRGYTNVVNQTLMDTSTGETRMGDQTVAVNTDGTATATLWAVGSDGNPVSWQTYFDVDYPRTGARDRQIRTFGPYTLTTADDGKNVTDLEEEQAVPAEYLTSVTEALQEFIDEGQALLDAQEEISGLTGEDDAVALLLTNSSDSRDAGDLRWARKNNVKVTVGKSAGYDFVTTDYASDDLALAAAVASLPTGFTSGGGWIELGPGTFDFVTGVDGSAKPNIKLTGCGFRTKIRWKAGNTFADTTPGVNYLFTGGYGFITFDIWWEGQSSYTCPINGVGTQPNSGGTNTKGGGILLTNGRNFIDRTYVNGMAEDGITNHGGIGNKFGLVEIIRCGGTGLNITGTESAMFPGVYATDQDFSSVWIASCNRGLYIAVGGQGIIAPHVWGCETDGIVIDAAYVRLIGAYPESNAGWGVDVRKPNVTVTACDVWSNGRGATPAGGIQLASTAVTGCIITGNQLRDNRADSVLVNGARYSQVTGNIVTDTYRRSASNPDSTISYTASGTQTLTTTFTDANAPSWMANAQAAMNCTVLISGAGAAGATLSAQVVGWNSTTSVTLSVAMSTVTVNPTYSVHAVSYGIREAGSAYGNDLSRNTVHKNDAIRGAVVPIQVDGQPGTRVAENMGVNSEAWYEAGNVGSGTLLLDTRNGGAIHATLTADVTTVTISVSGTTRRNQRLTVILTQDATGGRTVTGWPASVKFVGGIAPIVTPTASATWVLQLRYDGTNWIEESKSASNVVERRLASAVTWTNNTLTLVGNLTVPLAANTTVRVRGLLILDGGQTGDAKFRLTSTGATGSTGYWGITPGPAASSTSSTAVSVAPGNAATVLPSGGATPSIGTIGVGTYQFIYFEGDIVASSTAGAVEMWASQVTTDATALTIYPGSYMEVKKIA